MFYSTRKKVGFSYALFLFFLGFALSAEDITTQIHPVTGKPVQFVKKELLVKASPEIMSRLQARLPFQILHSIPELNVYQIQVPEGKEMEWLTQINLQADWVEPDYLYYPAVFPNDPSVSQQWYLSKISVFDAWEIHRCSPDVWVAVIDTGIDGTHPDLFSKVAPGGWDFVDGDGEPWENPGNGIDEDKNGRADEWVGHGTGVSGVIAAATDNQVGIAGVGWNCLILPIRVFPPDGATTSLVIAQATVFAAKIPQVKVINLSLAGSEESRALHEAIQFAFYQGKLVVAAAGNDNSSAPTFPASFPEVLGVAATTEADTKAQYSNYGNWVKIAAPGTGIYSTSMEKITGRHIYSFWSGTSFATPIVSGVAALLFSLRPDWSASQVMAHLIAQADSLPPPLAPAGRVNARKTLSAPDVTPPSLLSVEPLGNTRIQMEFSEPLSASPFTTGNASCFSPDISLYPPQLSADGVNVVLFTSPQRGGQRYAFSCSGFQDIAGNSTSFTADFIGTYQEANFARNATVSSVPAGAEALKDENLATFYTANTPVATVTLQLPEITWLDTIVLRKAVTQGSFEISAALSDLAYSTITRGFLTEQVVLHLSPFPARYLQLHFFDYPVPFQLAEIELYRRDMEPPELTGPVEVHLENGHLSFRWTVSEPSLASLFVRDKVETSWSEIPFGNLQYSFQSSFGPVVEGHLYEYYLRLTDGWGNNQVYPDVFNGQSPWVFFVHPILSFQHTPFICLVRNRSAKMSFLISPQPETVKLFYRTQPTGPFSELLAGFQNGTWEVSLPPDAINGFQMEYYLAAVYSGPNEIFIPSEGNFLIPIVPAGDGNRDGQITEADLLIIGQFFGETPDGIELPFSLDFDGNFLIDTSDWESVFSLIEE
ncbi:MAG: S8 family serine peptidase [bacterium JZ-2024 1]